MRGRASTRRQGFLQSIGKQVGKIPGLHSLQKGYVKARRKGVIRKEFRKLRKPRKEELAAMSKEERKAALQQMKEQAKTTTRHQQAQKGEKAVKEWRRGAGLTTVVGGTGLGLLGVKKLTED